MHLCGAHIFMAGRAVLHFENYFDFVCLFSGDPYLWYAVVVRFTMAPNSIHSVDQAALSFFCHQLVTLVWSGSR